MGSVFGSGNATNRILKQQSQTKADVQVLLDALKACSRTRTLEKGKQVHAEAIEYGHDCNIYLANALINMYAKCGSMVDAREVFDSITHPTVVSWNALILGHADRGEGHSALDLFARMRSTPNSVTFLAALKACTHLERDSSCKEMGKKLHSIVVENSCNSDVYVQSTLVDMYAKCGSMNDAHEVFECIKNPDVVSWNVLILGYADNGEGYTALDLFICMISEGCTPDSVTSVAALKACTSIAVKRGASGWVECRDWGKEIHNIAVENGWNSDVYVQNSLVDMYAKCGSMQDACAVFDSIEHLTEVSWNALMLGYVGDGQGHIALDLFTRMKTEGPAPDSVTFVASLKACTSVAVQEGGTQWAECRDKGKEIHNIAVETGCNSDASVQNTILDMYTKSGSILDAREVFDAMKNRTAVSWNVLILGYADNGQGDIALDLFTRMNTGAPARDSTTLVAALKACTSVAMRGANRWVDCRDRGKEIQNIAVENGCDSDVYVQSTLVDMYAKCGSMVDSREVFDDMEQPTLASWTALVLGYAENGEGHTGLEMFTKMRTEGPEPDSVTLVATLKACTSIAVKRGSRWEECKDRGKEIHNIATEYGFNSEIHVQGILVDMYANFGSLVDASHVFDGMKHPTLVSWNALVLGYVDNGQGYTALELFNRMRTQGPAPDSVTFVAVLKACGLVGALDFGRTIHADIETKNDLDVLLLNGLVDFYAKCGSLVESQSVFDTYARIRDRITWNALLAGFSSCGDKNVVFQLFERMQDEGVRPDGSTFLCILTCCSHAGLVVKGKECFDAMSKEYGIIPTVKHYTCMIDLFGRANMLDDAMAWLELMPCRPNEVTWKTILGACRKWKNVEIGRLAVKSLVDLKNDNEAKDLTGTEASHPGSFLW